MPSTPTPREPWIDMARGICVLLVVLFHVVIWHLGQVDAAISLPLWQRLNDVAGAIRMPLLLVLSGMLASGKVRRGRAALRGAAANYWLYLAWLAVYAVVLPLLAVPEVGEVRIGPSLLRQLVVPETPLWYVFALAVYLTGLFLLRAVPPAVVLALLFGMAMWVDPGTVMALKVPNLAFYFALGVYAAPLLRRVAAERPWILLPVSLVLVAVPTAVGRAGLTGLTEASFVAGNLGKGLMAIGLAALWCRHLGGIRPLCWTGRHTLAVYAMHPPLLAAWMRLWQGLPALRHALAAVGAWAMLYPAALTLLVSATALAVEALVRRGPLELLFGLPRRVQDRLMAWEGRVART